MVESKLRHDTIMDLSAFYTDSARHPSNIDSYLTQLHDSMHAMHERLDKLCYRALGVSREKGVYLNGSNATRDQRESLLWI